MGTKRGMKRARKEAGHEGEMGGEGQDKLQELNMQGKHVYTGRGNCDQQVGGNQTSRREGGQTEELRLREGKNDIMNPLAGRTVCQHLGKYWKYILNRKLSSCDWEERCLLLDKDHQGEGGA